MLSTGAHTCELEVSLGYMGEPFLGSQAKMHLLFEGHSDTYKGDSSLFSSVTLEERFLFPFPTF